MWAASKRKEFDVYCVGVVYTSVCTSLSVEAATARLNADHPTGIESAWKLADEPFNDGTANPHVCEDAPETHKHMLFVC